MENLDMLSPASLKKLDDENVPKVKELSNTCVQKYINAHRLD